MGNARSPGKWGLVDRPYPLFYSSCRAPTFIPPRAGGSARTCPFSNSEPAKGSSQGSTRREGERRTRVLASRLNNEPTIAAFLKMTYNWAWLLLLFSLVSIGTCLPTSLMEDLKKADQTMKPKSKRTQEMLIFGNQQSRQGNSAAATAAEPLTSNAEKRTLASSGLGGLKAALAEDDKPSQSKSPSNSVYEHETYSPYDRNYDYGKVLMNDFEEDVPRVWDTPMYYTGGDRRKRGSASEKTTTTQQPPIDSLHRDHLPIQHLPGSLLPTSNQQPQAKKSIPLYQDMRYKRELPLDIDPEDVLALLSLLENERRNGNWHKYATEEYENMIDDSGYLDEENGRNVFPWLDAPVYPSRHYDTLSPSDIGIVRTHPPSYYEQYGNQLDQQYGSPQYGNSQYDLVYPQRAYYPQEKRFMVAKKRAQSYDPFSAAELQLSSQPRSYQYPHRLIY